MDDNLKEYRSQLIEALIKAQNSYDKTVLTLSSGALGISMAFVKDIVGRSAMKSPGVLLGAWICWSLSTGCMLASFFFSQRAHRNAIGQLDTDKVYNERIGGKSGNITEALNVCGGVLFVLGTALIIIFAFINL